MDPSGAQQSELEFLAVLTIFRYFFNKYILIFVWIKILYLSHPGRVVMVGLLGLVTRLQWVSASIAQSGNQARLLNLKSNDALFLQVFCSSHCHRFINPSNRSPFPSIAININAFKSRERKNRRPVFASLFRLRILWFAQWIVKRWNYWSVCSSQDGLISMCLTPWQPNRFPGGPKV